MRLFLFVRHAHSTLNVEERVNGDPAVEVPLTAAGVEEATRLGHQIAQLPLDLCVHTRFSRTRETARAILGERDVPMLEEPLLDDIDVGDLEGVSIEEYRAWKHVHTRSDAFPGGESLDDAALRYAQALRQLLARPERSLLVVCHEIPIRYALNAAGGSDELDAPEHEIPNATPYLFNEVAVDRAAEGIERITRSE
jgi:broad specificity phosphatase PhoE